MATIKNFDRANLKTIRADLDKALAAVAKAHGITLDIGNIRFDSTSFRTTLNANVATGSTAKTTAAPVGVNPTWVANFKKYAVIFGLKPTDLNKQIKYAGKTVTIVGMRPKANAPLVVQRATGGCIAVSAEAVKSALATA
jgi:hypothetical protein